MWLLTYTDHIAAQSGYSPGVSGTGGYKEDCTHANCKCCDHSLDLTCVWIGHLEKVSLCAYQWYAYLGRMMESECSPRGLYLVRIVPIHSNRIHILFCCFKCLWKSLCEFHKYCHTLCVTWRYGVFLRDM